MARQNINTPYANAMTATAPGDNAPLPASETAKRLRACAYNPDKDVITITNEETHAVEQYLEVKYRMLWFHQYCAENNINGIVDEANICFIPEANLAYVTCKIYMNGELAATGIAGGTLQDNRSGIQNIATAAKGRALANLGFGTITATSSFGSGEAFPVDSGVPGETSKVPTMAFDRSTRTYTAIGSNGQNNTMLQNTPTPAQPSSIMPFNPASSALPQRQTGAMSMTLDQARTTIMPGGEFKGKTLAEIAGIQPNLIAWLAGDSYTGNMSVHAAAQTILDDMVKAGVWRG